MDATLQSVFTLCLFGGAAAACFLALTGGLSGRIRAPRFRQFRLRSPVKLPKTPRAPSTPSALGVAGPVAVGAALSLFGATGLTLQRLTNLLPWATLALALAAGGGLGFAISWSIWRYFIGGGTSAEEGVGSPIGRTGTVAIGVPAEGCGTVAIKAAGRNAVYPARCRDGGPMPVGTRVIVVDYVERTVVVEAV